jgi:uncharacterized HAD superfamily protein
LGGINIGIDLDGVLTDIQAFNRRYAPRFFKKKYNRDVINGDACDVCDIFGCTEAERYAYWRKHSIRYAVLEPARKGAGAFTRKLRAGGHEVYIISKRALAWQDDLMGRFMRFFVRNWLWWNGIRYSEIVFCDNAVRDSKRTACLEKRIDVMVDDEAVNIRTVAPIAKVICFDASYNRDCEGENITRARDWEEVHAAIAGLFAR